MATADKPTRHTFDTRAQFTRAPTSYAWGFTLKQTFIDVAGRLVADRDHIIESARLAWKSTQPKPTDPNARVAAIKEAAAAMQEILNDLERDHGVEVNDLTADIQRWAEGVSA